MSSVDHRLGMLELELDYTKQAVQQINDFVLSFMLKADMPGTTREELMRLYQAKNDMIQNLLKIKARKA